MKNVKTNYGRETLLDIIASYKRTIEREQASGGKYAIAVLDDIRASIDYVLSAATETK